MIAASAVESGHRRGSPGYRRLVLALLLAGVATFAQLYAPQGVLPLLAAGLHVDAAGAALTVSAATLGLALGALPWSVAADRFGRRTVLLAALAAATVAGLVAPLSPDLPTLLAVRLVEGFALGGVPATAVTYLTEEVTRSAAAVAAGTYVSGTTLGGLFGRIVAAPVADVAGWRAGLLVVGVAAALAAAGFALLAPAPRGRSRPPGRGARPALRDLLAPGLLVLYAQAFLLMGGFVAVYNYLGFRLEQPPFSVRPAVTALLFLAYLAGTVSSRVAGTAAAAVGRRPVLVGSIAVLVAGVLLTLPPVLPLVLAGLVLLTAGFFGAHAVAAGWVGARATTGRAQASSLYNVAYYTGSSLVGWAAGGAFLAGGWTGLALLVTALALVAAGWTMLAGGRDRIERAVPA